MTAAAVGGPALARLLERLELRAVGAGRFVDPGAPEPLHRIFGGQVAAQALVAMGRTVPDGRPPHSLHVTFLRPGVPGPPLEFAVEELKTGRAFAVRDVRVTQEGNLLLRATASFQRPEEGPRPTAPEGIRWNPPDVPRWEDAFVGRADRLSRLWARPRAFDVRFPDPPMLDPRLRDRPRRTLETYLRADGGLPPDPLLHAAALVYASDTTLLETALLPLGLCWADGEFDGASLDHAMWFHHVPRADDWLRFEQHADAFGHGRGTARGRMIDRAGDVVVTVVQEGSLRGTRGEGSWLAGTAADRTMPTPDQEVAR